MLNLPDVSAVTWFLLKMGTKLLLDNIFLVFLRPYVALCEGGCTFFATLVVLIDFFISFVTFSGPVIKIVVLILFFNSTFFEIPKIILAFGFNSAIALLIFSTSSMFKLVPPEILNKIFSAVKLLFWCKGLIRIFPTISWALSLPEACAVFKKAKLPLPFKIERRSAKSIFINPGL